MMIKNNGKPGSNLGENDILPKALNNFDYRSLQWLLAHLSRMGCDYFLDENQALRLQQHKQQLPSAIHSIQGTPPTNIELLPPYLNPSEIPLIISNTLNAQVNKEQLIDIIIRDKPDYLINKDNFDWIDISSHRPAIFLLTQLNLANIPLAPIQNIGSPKGLRDQIILRIDTWAAPHMNKIHLMNSLKALWSDVTANTRDTKWIDKSDINQINWAWNYLLKLQKNQTVLSPTNQTELYSAVLASIENFQCVNPQEKELFLIKMRKSWSQEKYRRSGKAKKQNYFGITVSAEAKVKSLTERLNLSPSQLIEQLIHEEHERIFKK